ncbi:pyruvate, phosphate dikinase, partial [Candidatus Woesearchaeota archaeon]|nr:pyruvate, phosphate dikinase [Candidatus Woesearchaeota archaeon]
MHMKNIYFFSQNQTDGKKEMKDLLGGKGANLAEMACLGLPVPPGFTISTEVCKSFYENNNQYPEGLIEEIKENMNKLEQATGKKFGDSNNPLLVSCRSGAAVSMPGMMDTVLNIGLNDETVEALAKTAGERFAYDSYRRLLQMFGDVVLNIAHDEFEEVLNKIKKNKLDIQLTSEDLKKIVEEYKKIYQKNNKTFPQEPEQQIKMAIDAVFGSWNNERAIAYRKINKITGLKGTAVNIQTMVFGNMGDDCGTGVAFTRDPSTGEKIFFGELLFNAQGEDVVAGIRTPLHIDDLNKKMPDIYNELIEIKEKLEQHYKDMQDIEFTIEKNKLYMLQTRKGKRTAKAAIRMAVEMKNEGLIDEKTALLRIETDKLDQLLHKTFAPLAKIKLLAKGLPASPGAAVGQIVFTAEEAEKETQKGKKVILVRKETSPEDIKGMAAAQGILTSTGGLTSHAAVVARGMGKCCVAGCSAVTISGKSMKINKQIFKQGDKITLNGTTGEVIKGQAPLVEPEMDDNFRQLMEWSNNISKLQVRTNADTPKDAKKAVEFGAQGIGLCRTEHMFFEGNRIKAVRKFIIADCSEDRKKALNEIMPM